MDIDILFGENTIDIAAVAIQLGSKPVNREMFGLIVEYGFYPLPYLHCVESPGRSLIPFHER